MAGMFKVGDRVRLKSGYLGSAGREIRERFSKSLVIIAIQDEMIRLSNGEDVGLCRLTCGVNNIYKDKTG